MGPVGGDYCEVMALEDRRSLFFAVGDVAGKGSGGVAPDDAPERYLPQPAVTAPAARRGDVARQPAVLREYADRALCDAGVRPDDRQRPRILQRGSLPAAAVTARTESSESTHRDCRSGCSAGASIRRRTSSLGEGDSLVLYSDGITEAQDPAGHEFGEDGLDALPWTAVRRRRRGGCPGRPAGRGGVPVRSLSERRPQLLAHTE